MYLRLGKNLFFLFGLTALVVIGMVSTNLLAVRLGNGKSVLQSSSSAPIGNLITRENRMQGSRSWEIPPGRGATTQIQAYGSAPSVRSSQKLVFYVSTQKEGTRYSLGIYRLGWYKGYGGRLLEVHTNLLGHAQGYYDTAKKRLVDCTSCHVEASTGLVEALWQPSYTLTIPSNWVTGVYLAKLADTSGWQTYVPFDVKGSMSSTYVAVTPDTTNAAYNSWGGYSLYRAITHSVGAHGVKVSFDRPNVTRYGSSQVLLDEVNAIRWFEQQGYDISYLSNVDIHQDPQTLLSHRAYLSLGHDEYWSKEMRDGVEQARNRGIGLAFLGANDVYWQIRFEPDSQGRANRAVVCYKVTTFAHDLTRDPFYHKDDSRVTTSWRDPVLNRPENALVGIMYSSSSRSISYPWKMSISARSALLAGTGLRPGEHYGCDLVGNEWDRLFNNGATPSNLQVLAASPTLDYHKHADVSNTAYYVASSGALVFATGAIYWSNGLDSYRYANQAGCPLQERAVPGIQKLLAHVMSALIIRHSAVAL